MSQSIAAKATRGANELVEKAQRMLEKAVAEQGAPTPFTFPNSVYYLPVILGESALAVEKIGDLQPVLKKACDLLAKGTTHAEKLANSGLAALLAAETIEALGPVERATLSTHEATLSSATFKSPISDIQVRTWGIQLADGRMPGTALLLGCANSNVAAAQLVQELRRHNILCLLSGSKNGRGLMNQLQEVGFQPGDGALVVSLGQEASSAVHALGFAARCAMKLGGHKPGQWPEILQYSKRRTPGFVLALGELGDVDWSIALAAKEFGYSVIADGAAPDAKQVISVPFETIAGADDAVKSAHLIEECIAARGLKLKPYKVDVPVAYGPAFEDEVISNADLHVQFGGQGRFAFEFLQTAATAEITDGRVEVIGADLPDLDSQAPADLGLVVTAAGKKLQTDFEPYLERQIHTFLSYSSGIEHTGSGDAIKIRISKAAVAKGLRLASLGKILHARFHEEFGTAVEKLEVAIITEPRRLAEWQLKAREAHDLRKQRLANLTDSQVDVFYVCRNCRSYAPNNVSIISPERVSPCGKCNWLDAKAAFEMNPAGVRRPVKLGKPIDLKRGVWEGTNEYAKAASHGRVSEIALYSIMQSPMSACGDFECIVMLIPEANGVMVVSHEDASLTPAGITVATFSAIAAGEQIPGVVGIGKNHLLSPKFIAAEGGFKRIVWMSSRLKEEMSEELKSVCVREGDPDFLNKIADERQASSVKELVLWLKEHKHPALEMERMF